jgi:hypothetical protein
MTRSRVLIAFALTVVFGTLLGACSDTKAVYPEKDKSDSAPQVQEKRESFLGMGDLFGGKKGGDTVGIGVNAFLWRASLDTLSFMPIATADPFGGTIITDWYQIPETPTERFKLNVFIMDRALRADGIKVSVFKQSRDSQGQWADVKVDPKMASDIENSILTRARQLRITSSAQP